METAKASRHDHPSGDNSRCALCRLEAEFELPPHLIAECEARNLVVFAGAGIRTETHTVLPNTLYEEVCRDLGCKPEDGGAFPDLMSRYCGQPNGRRLLIRKIRDRFANIESFSELYGLATRFHRELATLWLIETIITTNWDDYFERECGATPFVTADDFALWQVPGRKVFKLHGSVNSYGSLVATRADYEASYERLNTGLIGSNLKMMLATKTILYVGFSFRDDDFLRIHDILTAEMGGFRPQAYIVTLDTDSEARFREHGLIPIFTEGRFFIGRLKQHFVDKRAMLADENYDAVDSALHELNALHHRVTDEIDIRRYPSLVYTLVYQDGMKHAFDRILALRRNGGYSHICTIKDTVSTYEAIRAQALKQRNYVRAAYVEGYMDGHVYLAADDEIRARIPRFFVYGNEALIRSITGLRRILANAENLHKAAAARAAALVKKQVGEFNVIPHHPPYFID